MLFLLKRYGKLLLWVGTIAVLAEILRGSYLGLHDRYGHLYVTRAVVAFMERNAFRWPRSWQELDPYLQAAVSKELLSPELVKRYWGVAWDADPAGIFRPGKCSNGTPLIYELKRNVSGKGPWCFGDASSPVDRSLEGALQKAGQLKKQ